MPRDSTPQRLRQQTLLRLELLRTHKRETVDDLVSKALDKVENPRVVKPKPKRKQK